MALIQCLKLAASRCWSQRTLNAPAVAKPFKLFNQQQHFIKTDDKCKPIEPACGDRFNQDPCEPRQLEILLKQPAPEPLPPQKREIKLKRPLECCGNICSDAYPRFDLLYYKRTDKLNREYARTWAECPELIRKPKVICCFDNIKYPQLKKRLPQERPQTACPPKCSVLNYGCPFTTSEGCRRTARHPPSCKFRKLKINCKKRKAPYPAYSECSRKLPKPRRQIECRCLLAPRICEVWSVYHYKQRIKKPGLC